MGVNRGYVSKRPSIYTYREKKKYKRRECVVSKGRASERVDVNWPDREICYRLVESSICFHA